MLPLPPDLEHRLEQIELKMEHTESMVTSIQAAYAEDKRLLQEHDKILVRGNGVPSLQETVRNLSTGFYDFVVEYKAERADIKTKKVAELAEEKENRTWWKRTLIGLGLPLLIAFIGQAIVFWIKIAPLVEKMGVTK